MAREYWHAIIKDAMFAYRAEIYSGENLEEDGVGEFISQEIRYSAVREYADSLPKEGLLVDGIRLTRSKILSLLPKDKRTSPASSRALVERAKRQKSFR